MWTKGAVVVVKRGDEGFANSMEECLLGKHAKTPQKPAKRDDIRKKMRQEKTNAMILDARKKYGKLGRKRSKPLAALEVGYSLTACGIAWLVNRVKNLAFRTQTLVKNY